MSIEYTPTELQTNKIERTTLTELKSYGKVRHLAGRAGTYRSYMHLPLCPFLHDTRVQESG
jgi:hypothetical protein